MIPFDEDAERAVIGSLITSRRTADDIIDRLDASDFYVPMHRQLFDAAAQMRAREEWFGESIDGLAAAANVALADVRAIKAEGWHSYYGPFVERLHAVGDLRRGIDHLVMVQLSIDAGDVESMHALLAEGADRVATRPAMVEPALDMREIAAEEIPDSEFLIPGLLTRGDRLMITGGEGHGKSTLLAQIAVSIASGLHPFSHERTRGLTVYQLDCENPPLQVKRMGMAMLALAGDHYHGGWFHDKRPQGIDLTRRADQAWLEGKCTLHLPDVLIIGPLYKLYSGSIERGKHTEEAAESITAYLDRLRTRFKCALLIEAHSPKGEGGDRGNYAPIGSSLWLRWPEFIFGMKPITEGEYEMVRPRMPRDADRQWPTHIRYGQPWPWEAFTRAPRKRSAKKDEPPPPTDDDAGDDADDGTQGRADLQ